MVINVRNNIISLIKDSTLIRKSKKPFPIHFIFDETWNGFAKTVLFKTGDKIVSVDMSDDTCYIPQDCLDVAGVVLKVRVVGQKENIEKTTDWCYTSYILNNVVIDTPENIIEKLFEKFAETLLNCTDEEVEQMLNEAFGE